MKPIEKNNLNSDSAFLVHIIHVSAQFGTIKTTLPYYFRIKTGLLRSDVR